MIFCLSVLEQEGCGTRDLGLAGAAALVVQGLPGSYQAQGCVAAMPMLAIGNQRSKVGPQPLGQLLMLKRDGAGQVLASSCLGVDPGCRRVGCSIHRDSWSQALCSGQHRAELWHSVPI